MSQCRRPSTKKRKNSSEASGLIVHARSVVLSKRYPWYPLRPHTDTHTSLHHPYLKCYLACQISVPIYSHIDRHQYLLASSFVIIFAPNCTAALLSGTCFVDTERSTLCVTVVRVPPISTTKIAGAINHVTGW